MGLVWDPEVKEINLLEDKECATVLKEGEEWEN